MATDTKRNDGQGDLVIDERGMPRDLIALRMENETIMSACAERPRDMATIKADLVEQFELFPESADMSIYTKPVGKDERGKMKYAEGLSIRAAETLAEAYGFNRVRCDVTPLDDDRVKVEATFTDFQRGRIWQDGGIVSRLYKTRNGQIARMPEDRFYNTTVRAEGSKRVREVILRCINASLKAWYFAECKRTMASLLTDEKLSEIVAYFGNLGCDVAALEKIVGRPKSMGWTVQDRSRLHGIANALKDNETTLAEVLEQAEPSENGVSALDAKLAESDVKKREVTSEKAKVSKGKAAKKPEPPTSKPVAEDAPEATPAEEPARDESEASDANAEPQLEPGQVIGSKADPGEIISLLPKDFVDMLDSGGNSPQGVLAIREHWEKKTDQFDQDVMEAIWLALDEKLEKIRKKARGGK